MPPQTSNPGWKAFFSLLMVLQIVGIGVMWRTYDAIQETSFQTKLNTYQIENELKPKIAEHEKRLNLISK